MRCYNGCPDDELQALLDDAKRAEQELAAAGMRAVYFPSEGAWMVFRDLTAVTGFCGSKRAAANAALRDRKSVLQHRRLR